MLSLDLVNEVIDLILILFTVLASNVLLLLILLHLFLDLISHLFFIFFILNLGKLFQHILFEEFKFAVILFEDVFHLGCWKTDDDSHSGGVRELSICAFQHILIHSFGELFIYNCNQVLIAILLFFLMDVGAFSFF